jgi:hypothetical protein
VTKSADSGISAKGVKFENPAINNGHSGDENAGYRVTELLSTFRNAPKPSTGLKRKIEETSTGPDQLVNEASQDLIQILSRHFSGMDKATIDRVVENVAATYRNKIHFEQHSPVLPDFSRSEKKSPVFLTPQLASPEEGNSIISADSANMKVNQPKKPRAEHYSLRYRKPNVPFD